MSVLLCYRRAVWKANDIPGYVLHLVQYILYAVTRASCVPGNGTNQIKLQYNTIQYNTQYNTLTYTIHISCLYAE